MSTSDTDGPVEPRDQSGSSDGTLRILCLEDSPDDAELMHESLVDAGFRMEMTVTDARAGFEHLLRTYHPDVIIADYTLPDFDAPAALRMAQDACPTVPFICVSGTIGEDKAVAMIKAGAIDYVLKDRLSGLPLAVEHALAQARFEAERRRADRAEEEKTRGLEQQAAFLATLLDTIPSPVFYKDADGVYLGCNRAFEEYLGRPRGEIIGEGAASTGPADITDMYARKDRELLENPGRQTYEWKVQGADGTTRDVLFNKATFAGPNGDIGGIIGVMLDISERKATEDALAEGRSRLHDALHDTVRAMGAVVELRDPYTSGHEQRVTELAAAVAREMDLAERAIDTIRLAGEVHDIGKIGVPAEILSKPGTLTQIERNLINQHPVLGYEILAPIAFGGPVAETVHQHHERLDGSGYPRALRGDDILLEARVLAVADVVEAMASHRPYRPALGVRIALDEVRQGAGERYDPAVVDACERVFAAGFELDQTAGFGAS